MPTNPVTSPRPIGRLAAFAVIVAVAAWFAIANIRLSLLGAYGLDEFQYAHAGWRIAQGEVIYRDFFEHHFPLLHQLLAVAWRFLDDDPQHLQTLRTLLLPVLALMAWAGYRLNREACGRWALATVPLLWMIPTLSSMSIQVRPDPLAAALFVAALAVLRPSRLAARWRGLIAGVLVGLALWATLKVAYYGIVIVAALIADLWPGRRRGEAPFLARPGFFVAGAGIVAAAAGTYLTLTASWGDWYRWCIDFSFTHQWRYPGFAWQGNLEQMVRHAWWLVPLGAIGVVTTSAAVRRRGGRDPDLLLLGALITTFASFVWQSAPYLYSLAPFTLVLTVFAGRGLVAAARALSDARLGDGGKFAWALLALLALGDLRRTDVAFAKLAADSNETQRARLERLAEMTRPDQAVFHVWGGQISRPAVHFFYFLEAVTMEVEAPRLRRELVPAMVEKAVTVYLHHDLFPRLVPELRAYLLSNFLPYDEGLWVWGRRFARAGPGPIAGDFAVVRAGRHFVWPAEAATAITVAGQPLAEPVFVASPGRYPVRYDGPLDAVSILWLPEDGRTFAPRPELLRSLVSP